MIGGLDIFINSIVGYIDLEGSSCPGERRIEYFFKYYLVYIDVDGAYLKKNTRR